MRTRLQGILIQRTASAMLFICPYRDPGERDPLERRSGALSLVVTSYDKLGLIPDTLDNLSAHSDVRRKKSGEHSDGKLSGMWTHVFLVSVFVEP